MKNIKNFFLLFGFIGFTYFFNSCDDPCSGVICDDGNCSNGVCVCNEGYQRKSLGCISVARLFMNVDSTASATWLAVDSNGNANPTINNVLLEFMPSSVDPYTFKLLTFGGFNGNDILFSVSNTNFSIIPEATVSTDAGNTYLVSGARTDTQVQLSIRDESNKTVYTLSYTTDH